MATSIEVVIVGNSIFANSADGIDFDDEIVDPPEIVSLTSFPGELRFEGSLDGEPSTTYRIEIFASDSATASNDNEGQRLLGRAAGDDRRERPQLRSSTSCRRLLGGQWITATATRMDVDGETLLATSEFSEAVQVNAAAGADLAVTITDIPDPVFLGESVTYTVQVTNHGPSAATGVIVVASGPVGQPFNSVTIPIGGLASGTSSSFQLAFTPTALGTFSATATVMASEDDPNPANNSFTETTLVKSGVTFELEQPQYEVREGEEFAVLRVRRTGSLASSVSVDFETVNGTAGQRGIKDGLVRVDDFTTTSGTLSFRARSNVATIRVPIIDDNRLESDETFRVVLSNPSGGRRVGPAQLGHRGHPRQRPDAVVLRLLVGARRGCRRPCLDRGAAQPRLEPDRNRKLRRRQRRQRHGGRRLLAGRPLADLPAGRDAQVHSVLERQRHAL